ncbi:MAG: tyrosine-type recombinase/integrase [Candidatus Thermoplasmatota archaeon]|nr:tyrosine-type recombinase/integrase [Candidatus Thermoplasmatota archaeon]
MVEKKLESNENNLKNFIISVTNKYQTNTIKSYQSLLSTFSNTIDKPFKDITRDDIDRYLATLKPPTAEIMKSKLRAFFKWFYDCDKKTLPKVVSHLESNKKALAPKKTDADVLSPDEIEKLINAHAHIAHKALIETFIVTGARCNEIRNLNIGDVKEEDGIIWYNFRVSKTKMRKVPVYPNADNPVARYPKYLIMWKDKLHPMKEDPLAPMFISFTNRRYHQRMTNDGIASLVKQARKTAKLTRHITPHILRHTGASYDGGYLTEQDLGLKYGWVVGSDMARRYCHTSENRLAERLKKIAGVKEDEQQVRKCPRCGESNSNHAENCEKCNQILDFKKLTEELEKRKGQQKDINKIEKELKKEITDLQTELKKKTEIDNFIMDSLGLIAKEMVQNQGIEAIKEIFRKYNVPLIED